MIKSICNQMNIQCSIIIETNVVYGRLDGRTKQRTENCPNEERKDVRRTNISIKENTCKSRFKQANV